MFDPFSHLPAVRQEIPLFNVHDRLTSRHASVLVVLIYMCDGKLKTSFLSVSTAKGLAVSMYLEHADKTR